jgi:nitronate monooxygenase
VDDIDIAPVIVGEAADLIRAIEPAQDRLHGMIVQAEDHLRRISRLVEPTRKGQRR